MQRILVYIIIGVAVVVTAWLHYRRWRKPEDCARQEGCKDCPLADKCEKKEREA